MGFWFLFKGLRPLGVAVKLTGFLFLAVLWEPEFGNTITSNENCILVPVSGWYLPHKDFLFFPPKTLYQMLNIFFNEIDDRGEGIVVGDSVEIECAAQEIACAVGQVKLKGRSRIRA